MAELTYFSTFFVVYLSKIYTGKVVYPKIRNYHPIHD